MSTKKESIDCRLLCEPREDDLAAIIRLYREAGWWGAGPNDRELAAGIVAGSHCFAVAAVRGEMVGMGRAISDGVSDAYLQDVFVHPDQRNHGVATAIVAALLDRLEGDGLGWVGLVASNGSREMYERLGFVPMTGATALLRRR